MWIPVAGSGVKPVRARREGRLGLLVLSAMAMGLAGCNLEDARATSQDATSVGKVLVQRDTTLTPLMLRVAAEALDGMRTGELVHLVVTYGRDPQPLIFRDASTALAAESAGRGRYLPGVAVDETSDRLWRVVEVRVVVDSAGTRRTLRAPANADLIAWKLPAVDKFVVPYYTRVRGLPAATALRQRFTNSDRYMLYCHDGKSIDCVMEELSGR
jgi:hypothetical protein